MHSCSQSLLILALLIVAVPAQSGLAVDPAVVEHGPRDAKKIALTFDACPTSKEDEYDEKVIEVLVREKVPATLFMSGRWVEKNKDTAKSLAAKPQFEIANHAFWHPHMLEKDDERILRELKRTQDIIRKVTGKRPKYFRPPFGEVDERLARLAAQTGLVTVQYDIASGDPDPGLSAKKIIRGVVGEAKGGSIVVFHMNENGVRTAEVLPEVIRQLREKGFELVTVGEMLKTADTGTRGHGDKGSGKRTGGQGDKGTGRMGEKGKGRQGDGEKIQDDKVTSPTTTPGDRQGQGGEKTIGTGTGPAATMTSTRDTSTSQGTDTQEALHSAVEGTGSGADK